MPRPNPKSRVRPRREESLLRVLHTARRMEPLGATSMIVVKRLSTCSVGRRSHSMRLEMVWIGQQGGDQADASSERFFVKGVVGAQAGGGGQTPPTLAQRTSSISQTDLDEMQTVSVQFALRVYT